MKADYEIYDFKHWSGDGDLISYSVCFRIFYDSFNMFDFTTDIFRRHNKYNAVDWFCRHCAVNPNSDLFLELENLHQKRINNETTI